MINNVVLVGRLTADPEVRDVNEKKVCNITLAVPRTYKNNEGEYNTDFIRVTLWEALAQNITEYTKKGDVVGVKGRIQTTNVTDEEGKITDVRFEVIAEKISFLSSKKED